MAGQQPSNDEVRDLLNAARAIFRAYHITEGDVMSSARPVLRDSSPQLRPLHSFNPHGLDMSRQNAQHLFTRTILAAVPDSSATVRNGPAIFTPQATGMVSLPTGTASAPTITSARPLSQLRSGTTLDDAQTNVTSTQQQHSVPANAPAGMTLSARQTPGTPRSSASSTPSWAVTATAWRPRAIQPAPAVPVPASTQQVPSSQPGPATPSASYTQATLATTYDDVIRYQNHANARVGSVARKPFVVVSDDVSDVQQTLPTWVAVVKKAMFLLTYQAPPATRGVKSTNGTRMTEEDNDKWDVWQNRAMKDVKHLQSKAGAVKTAECQAWAIVEGVVNVHLHGYVLGADGKSKDSRKKPDATLICSQRLQVIIQGIEKYAIVRLAAWNGMDMDKWAVNPSGEILMKVLNHFGNSDKADKLASAPGGQRKKRKRADTQSQGVAAPAQGGLTVASGVQDDGTVEADGSTANTGKDQDQSGGVEDATSDDEESLMGDGDDEEAMAHTNDEESFDHRATSTPDEETEESDTESEEDDEA